MTYRPWWNVTVSSDVPKHNSEIEKSHYAALNALKEGQADAHQQVKALHAILWMCGVDQTEYEPDSERDTAFRGGKRHIGLQIRRILDNPLKQLQVDHERSTGSDKRSDRNR